MPDWNFGIAGQNPRTRIILSILSGLFITSIVLNIYLAFESNSLERALSNMKRADDRKGELEASVFKLEHHISILEKDNEDLKDRNNTLEWQVENWKNTSDSLRKQNSEDFFLKQELESLKKEKKSLQDEIERLRLSSNNSNSSGNWKLEKQIADLKDEKFNLEKINASQNQKISELNTQILDFNQGKFQTSSLQSENSFLTARVKNLETQLRDAKSDADALRYKMRSATDIVSDHEEEEKLRRKILILEKNLKNMEDENSSLEFLREETTKGFETQRTQLQDEITALKDQNLQNLQAVTDLETALRDLQTERFNHTLTKENARKAKEKMINDFKDQIIQLEIASQPEVADLINQYISKLRNDTGALGKEPKEMLAKPLECTICYELLNDLPIAFRCCNKVICANCSMLVDDCPQKCGGPSSKKKLQIKGDILYCSSKTCKNPILPTDGAYIYGCKCGETFCKECYESLENCPKPKCKDTGLHPKPTLKLT
jgi:cell division protein FtsB